MPCVLKIYHYWLQPYKTNLYGIIPQVVLIRFAWATTLSWSKSLIIPISEQWEIGDLYGRCVCVPQKSKILLWRATRECLLTGVNIQHKGVNCDVVFRLCPQCNRLSKDDNHCWSEVKLYNKVSVGESV